MTHKNLFLISLLFAFFGIQSINAQVDNHSDTMFYQGWADGLWWESFWEGHTSSLTSLPLTPGEVFGVMYLACDDGGEGIYHDLGRNFVWTAGDGENIYQHEMPEYPDDNDIIQFWGSYDGFDLLQTGNYLYLRTTQVNYSDTRVLFILYR